MVQQIMARLCNSKDDGFTALKLLPPFLIVPRAKIQSMTKAKGCVAKIFLLMLPVLLLKFYSVAMTVFIVFLIARYLKMILVILSSSTLNLWKLLKLHERLKLMSLSFYLSLLSIQVFLNF